MDTFLTILRKASYSNYPVELARELITMEFDQQKIAELALSTEIKQYLQLFLHQNHKFIRESISILFNNAFDLSGKEKLVNNYLLTECIRYAPQKFIKMLPLLIIRPGSSSVLKDLLQIEIDSKYKVNSEDFHNALLNVRWCEGFKESLLKFSKIHDPEYKEIRQSPEKRPNELSRFPVQPIRRLRLDFDDDYNEPFKKEISTQSANDESDKTEHNQNTLKHSTEDIKTEQFEEDKRINEQLKAEIEKLKKELTDDKNELIRRENEFHDLQNKWNDVSGTVEQLQNQIKQLKSQLETQKSEYQKVISNLETEKAELIEQLNHSTEDAIDEQFEKDKRINEQLKSEIERLKKVINNDKNELARRENELHELQNKWNDEASIRAKILNMSPEEFKDMSTKFEQQSIAIEKAKQELDQKRDKINSSMFKAQLAEKTANEKLAEIEEEKARIEEMLKELYKLRNRKDPVMEYERLHDEDIYIEPIVETIQTIYQEIVDTQPQPTLTEYPYDEDEEAENVQVRRVHQPGWLRGALYISSYM